MKLGTLIYPALLFPVLLAGGATANGWLDSTELILSSNFLGISHPPGAPLYMILAKGAGLLPLGSIALRTTVLSSLLLALSLLVFIEFCRAVFEKYGSRFHLMVIGSVSLAIFLTYTFMVQGVRTELYSLNILLASLLFLFFFKGNIEAGCFILGLSMGCHPLISLSVVPALMVVAPREANKLGKVVRGFIFFIAGLSIYLYLPIRAGTHPFFNFGSPSDAQSLFWVLTGKLYGAKSYGGFDLYRIYENTINLILLYSEGLTYPVFGLSLVGVAVLLMKRRRIGLFLLLGVVLNSSIILVNMHFDPANPDAHGYLMPSFLLLGIGCLASLFILGEGFYEYVKREFRRFAPVVAAAVLLFPLYPLFKFYGDYSQGSDYSARKFGEILSKGLPYSAVVFTGSFATHSNLSYLNAVERYRDDVTAVFAGFIENRGYLSDLKANYPSVFRNVEQADFRYGAPLLEQIAFLDRPVYVELSIKERDGGYGLRQPMELLAKLCPDGWFFRYGCGKNKNFMKGYKRFIEGEIVSSYGGSDFEFRKNALLCLFLHSRFFAEAGDNENFKYLVNTGHRLNPDFEPFRRPAGRYP